MADAITELRRMSKEEGIEQGLAQGGTGQAPEGNDGGGVGCTFLISGKTMIDLQI
jgi:hypothetical protein